MAVAFDQPLEKLGCIFGKPNVRNLLMKLIHYPATIRNYSSSFSTNSKWPYDWSEFVRPISNLLSVLDLNILENQPIGTTLGEFKASHANDLAINYH